MGASNSKIYINKYGDKIYYNSNWEYHRINGPAVEYLNGTKYWFKEGLFHRVDGPAIDYLNKNKRWYVLDKKLKEKEFNSWILRIQKCI